MRVVELSNHPGDMLSVEASASRLDRDQCAAIADLIQRDHACHGKRRHPARRAPSPVSPVH